MDIGKTISYNLIPNGKDNNKMDIMFIMRAYIRMKGHFENENLIWRIRRNLLQINREQIRWI